jgi:hydrocephalus-inducing protein
VEDFNYKLMADIPGLHAEVPPLVIPLSGKAQRPVCHFELDPCTYVSTRSAELPGPNGEIGRLDPSVRVLQMQSLGTLVKNTKRFYAINPMNVGYDFQWEPVGAAAHPAFRCTSTKGMMVAGKKTEMVFEYTPSEVGLHESFWQFRIPSQGITQLFLIVGSVVEPNVTLDRSRIQFQPVLLGRSATETVHLVNHEHIPFNFNFDRASFDTGALVGGSKKPTIDVNPVSGTIPPNGRKAIEITFCPEEDKMHNFNIVSLIRRKPGKLSLNVKGEGYAIQSKVSLVHASGESTPLVAGGSTLNYVDFGGVFLNEKVQKTIVISNSGKFNFDFSLLSAKGDSESEDAAAAAFTSNSKTLSISPASGSVKKGERVEVVITFQPLAGMVLDGQTLSLTVAGSMVFPLALKGRGQQPGLSFSFMSHDFGPCFVASHGNPAQPETVMLRVTNHEVDTGERERERERIF